MKKRKQREEPRSVCSDLVGDDVEATLKLEMWPPPI